MTAKPNILAAHSGDNPNLGKAIPLQGLKFNTLVAGKTTALKMFFAPSNVEKSFYVTVTITKPDNSQSFVSWIKQEVLPDHWDPDYKYCQVFFYRLSQPYLVGRLRGADIPNVGRYHFSCKIYEAGNNTALETIELDQDFLPTKDLCVMVSRVWGQPLTWDEIYEAHRAMSRLSALFPIRDGLSYLNGAPRTAGLRYNTDFNPYPSDANLSQLYDRYLQQTHNDPIHLGIAFRYPDVGEGSGGNAPHWLPNGLPFSLIVWGKPLAFPFCQETGHIFSLEPPNSPNFDGGAHSTQVYINTRDFSEGFDIQYNKPFPVPVYDVMYPYGIGASDDHVSLSSWDWEYLRQKILTLNSTGP